MLPLADVLHRSIVLGLVGITGWGLYTGTRVHLHILEAGRLALAEREAQGLESANDVRQQREMELAEQATKNMKPT